MAVIDFSNAPSRQEFWLGSLVGPGLSLLWAAPPKTGKSFAVMQLGYALATGRSIWGFDASTPKRVLYFQGEISDEIVFDRISSCFSNLTPFERGDYAVTSRPDRSFSLIQHPEALYSVAKDADIVIVDPVSLFNPGDENDFASVRNFLDVFGPLKKAGKAVILVHHTRKLGGQRKAGVEDVRGSNAWHAHVDAVVVQSRTDVLGDKDNLHTRVEFSLRGGRDIAPFLLYRLNNGSFTHVFEELLFQSNADQGGLYDEASDGRYTN